MKRRCSDCDVFDKTWGAIGMCRRHTPVIAPDGGTFWPEVNEDDWCGEFSERDDAPEGEDAIKTRPGDGR